MLFNSVLPRLQELLLQHSSLPASAFSTLMNDVLECHHVSLSAADTNQPLSRSIDNALNLLQLRKWLKLMPLLEANLNVMHPGPPVVKLYVIV